MVGLFDVQKDHFGLLSVLYLVKQSGINFKFTFIGRCLNLDNAELVTKIRDLVLDENVNLLDQRSTIPSIMNGLDRHVLFSLFGEAPPNVVAEAMAYGTPGIVTDVCNAALIVCDDVGLYLQNLHKHLLIQ
jgi:glycosyltransferase involved in cell wall biosynthesis